MSSQLIPSYQIKINSLTAHNQATLVNWWYVLNVFQHCEELYCSHIEIATKYSSLCAANVLTWHFFVSFASFPLFVQSIIELFPYISFCGFLESQWLIVRVPFVKVKNRKSQMDDWFPSLWWWSNRYHSIMASSKVVLCMCLPISCCTFQPYCIDCMQGASQSQRRWFPLAIKLLTPLWIHAILSLELTDSSLYNTYP